MRSCFCLALITLVVSGIIFPNALCAAITGSERQALIALYEATDGPSWLNSDHWLEPLGTENTWYGVVTDSGNTTVTGLFLWDNELSGTIPIDLKNLHSLRQLFLTGNRIQGPIPPELGSLNDLIVLDLSGNELTGSIPSELSGLTNLLFLQLDDNQLGGVLPNELGALPMLRQLRLTWNRLVGEVPADYASLGLAEKTSSVFPGGGLDLCGNNLSASDTEARNLIQSSHVGGIAGFEACQENAAIQGPSPEEGIWASCSGDIRFYLQKYSTGSCIIVVLSNQTLRAFLDPDTEDGLVVSEDVYNRKDRVGLFLTSPATGILSLDFPDVSRTFSVSLDHAAWSPSEANLPVGGIWRAEDDSRNIFLQHYQTGACILVTTYYDHLTAFLFPDCRDELVSERNIFSEPHSIAFEPIGPTEAEVTLDVPGTMGTFNFNLVYEDLQNGQ